MENDRKISEILEPIPSRKIGLLMDKVPENDFPYLSSELVTITPALLTFLNNGGLAVIPVQGGERKIFIRVSHD